MIIDDLKYDMEKKNYFIIFLTSNQLPITSIYKKVMHIVLFSVFSFFLFLRKIVIPCSPKSKPGLALEDLDGRYCHVTSLGCKTTHLWCE